MPNPNELARLDEELKHLKDNLYNGRASKSTKEYLLREIHKIEETLGLEPTHYNRSR